ncbi:MAG: hypothetical protein R3C19_10090 [Planctomycetaceae bacterium]
MSDLPIPSQPVNQNDAFLQYVDECRMMDDGCPNCDPPPARPHSYGDSAEPDDDPFPPGLIVCVTTDFAPQADPETGDRPGRRFTVSIRAFLHRNAELVLIDLLISLATAAAMVNLTGNRPFWRALK